MLRFASDIFCLYPRHNFHSVAAIPNPEFHESTITLSLFLTIKIRKFGKLLRLFANLFKSSVFDSGAFWAQSFIRVHIETWSFVFSTGDGYNDDDDNDSLKKYYTYTHKKQKKMWRILNDDSR